jgi:hypothetical protein
MKISFGRIIVMGWVACAAVTGTAVAGDLKLTIGNGRATLVAHDVPLGQILAEWARLGQTTIVNGDKLNAPPMTLELVDRPEREVLEVLLKSASGYIAAQRSVNIANASVFDRVMILPVSRGPVGAAAIPPPQFGRTNMGQPLPPPVSDDDDEPMDPAVPMNQPMVNQPPPPFPAAPNQQPGQQPTGQQPPGQQPPVMTSPRPGMLPAPPPNPETPYGTQPPNVRLPPGAPGNPDR